MARRAIWSGSISFGLVNIPIRMFNATEDRDIHFRLLHDQDKSTLQRKLISSTTGKEVHPEHIVRGFEVSKDQYVVVQKNEVESCAPEKSRAIEITDFVDLGQIDPVYYDRPYYLAPQPTAAKAYQLLVEALQKSGKVALANFVMHEKQHLAALRPLEHLICLEMMRYADEIVSPDQIEKAGPNLKLTDRELKAALQLIESLSGDFEPGRYTDEYRDCIMSLVERKSRGEEIHVRPPAEHRGNRAADLMSALEASLEQAGAGRKHRASHGNGHFRRQRRKSA
jgi:DNA end-binding protein Ku